MTLSHGGPGSPGRGEAVATAPAHGERVTESGGRSAGEGLAEDERAELARLRAEVAALRAVISEAEGAVPEPGAATAPPAARPGRGATVGRWTAAIALIVVASLLALVAVVARYARAQVLDTDRYVATVSPLINDPAVQAEITDQVTDQIFGYLDVESLLDRALVVLVERGVPEQVEGLAEPLANGVRSFVHNLVARVVASDEFEELWISANRAAHDNLVAVLTGEGEAALQVEGTAVTVDLAALIATVKQRLLDRGISVASRIPEVSAQFTIAESEDLPRLQRAVRLLDRSAIWLPIIALVLAAIAIAVAPNRRRAVLALGVGVAVAMVVLAVALALGRAWYLDRVPPETLSPAAATSLIDAMLAPMRVSLRALLLVGLIVAAAAYLTGPSGGAVAIRRAATRGIGALRERAAGSRPPSAFELWVAGHKTALRIAVVALGLLIYAFWSYPTPRVAIVTVIAVLLGLVVIEFVGRGPRPEPTAPSG